MSHRRLPVGCAVMVCGNAMAFVTLAYLALRAGVLFPTDCAPPVTVEECSAIHGELAEPFFLVFWPVLIANFIGLIWLAIEQRLTKRQ
jgi:hypothetical protein